MQITVESKLEKSRSSSSLLACRPRMFHCKIIGIKNQKGFWLSKSESASSASVSTGEYRLFVGSSESDFGGLLSFGLPFLSALLDWVFWGLLKAALGEGRRMDGPFPFLKMSAATAKYYFRFRICWCHCLQKVSSNQILLTYLNWQLRYNYFRFRKTNVRHIGNLLPVSISTIWPKSPHYSASGYRISSKSEHPLRKYDVISISQDGGRDR